MSQYKYEVNNTHKRIFATIKCGFTCLFIAIQLGLVIPDYRDCVTLPVPPSALPSISLKL